MKNWHRYLVMGALILLCVGLEYHFHIVRGITIVYTHLFYVPIIALTSYAMPEDKEKALAAGCTGYVTKPIDPETFMEEIERYL